ncbi:hypothetical protein BD289DRAFT_433586 [Coniella lustricola]|uniref:Uncharacterized protein n=1 Tax=Coniella lustricola TaxID=2025994 RepID=A0A2T3A8D0_9PEZI|nr:hypothetical protein BD289DRAFT_433586 [Coniella lustricola]
MVRGRRQLQRHLRRGGSTEVGGRVAERIARVSVVVMLRVVAVVAAVAVAVRVLDRRVIRAPGQQRARRRRRRGPSPGRPASAARRAVLARHSKVAVVAVVVGHHVVVFWDARRAVVAVGLRRGVARGRDGCVVAAGAGAVGAAQVCAAAHLFHGGRRWVDDTDGRHVGQRCPLIAVVVHGGAGPGLDGCVGQVVLVDVFVLVGALLFGKGQTPRAAKEVAEEPCDGWDAGDDGDEAEQAHEGACCDGDDVYRHGVCCSRCVCVCVFWSCQGKITRLTRLFMDLCQVNDRLNGWTVVWLISSETRKKLLRKGKQPQRYYNQTSQNEQSYSDKTVESSDRLWRAAGPTT